MAEIRKDLLRDTWVVIATGRAVRPTDLPVPSREEPKKFKVSARSARAMKVLRPRR